MEPPASTAPLTGVCIIILLESRKLMTMTRAVGASSLSCVSVIVVRDAAPILYSARMNAFAGADKVAYIYPRCPDDIQFVLINGHAELMPRISIVWLATNWIFIIFMVRVKG